MRDKTYKLPAAGVNFKTSTYSYNGPFRLCRKQEFRRQTPLDVSLRGGVRSLHAPALTKVTSRAVPT